MQASAQGQAGPRLLVTLWVAAMCFGFVGLFEYGSAPCDPGEPVSRWPSDAGLGAHADAPELLLFAHALCPCTRATLSELERVLTRAPRAPRTRVVLWTDPDQPEHFEHSDLRERVRAVPSLELVEDPHGRLARAFGARTSGMTLCFDADGRRVFAGGLTSSRGHEGTSAGTLALDALLRGEPTERSVTPVFGCALVDDAEVAR